MRILAIETSCDETAVSIINASGGALRPKLSVLANITLSQTVHAQYGGVFPMLAKREHSKNLVPIITQALKDAKLFNAQKSRVSLPPILEKQLTKTLKREPELLIALRELLTTTKPPRLDAIAVTYGPGLEPALWVGVNCARALSLTWSLPLIPVNHMEGHMYGSLIEERGTNISFASVPLPAVALLVSGGHTELILIKNLGAYTLLGKTRDDAVGEAFDKVARMLGLPYPGGPAISKLATIATGPAPFSLPRPMLHSDNLDFSFAGLKTAVLYGIKKLGHEPTDQEKQTIAREFQNAVVETIVSKVTRAATTTHARTVIAGGGVAANSQIRAALTDFATQKNLVLRIPPLHLTTDNALMIAITAYFLALKKKFASPKTLRANGNLIIGRRSLY